MNSIVSISEENGLYVVSLNGLLNNQTCMDLHEQTDDLSLKNNLLLDFANLEEIDGSGLGSIVCLSAKFVSNNRKVRTINCSGQPRLVIFGLRMDTFLNVYPKRSLVGLLKRSAFPEKGAYDYVRSDN